MTNHPILKALLSRSDYCFEDFVFQHSPLLITQQLYEDIRVLCQLSKFWLGMEAEQLALLYMDEQARQLLLRYGGNDQQWNAFLYIAAALDRDALRLRQRRQAAREAVTALAVGNRFGHARAWAPSPATVRVGAALLDTVTSEFRLTADQPLPNVRHPVDIRCHFQLHDKRDPTKVVRVEVFDDVSSACVAKTDLGVAQSLELVQRLQGYSAAGVEPPVVVYTDQLCDRLQLDDAVRRIIVELDVIRHDELGQSCAAPEFITHPAEDPNSFEDDTPPCSSPERDRHNVVVLKTSRTDRPQP